MRRVTGHRWPSSPQALLLAFWASCRHCLFLAAWPCKKGVGVQQANPALSGLASPKSHLVDASPVGCDVWNRFHSTRIFSVPQSSLMREKGGNGVRRAPLLGSSDSLLASLLWAMRMTLTVTESLGKPLSPQIWSDSAQTPVTDSLSAGRTQDEC